MFRRPFRVRCVVYLSDWSILFWSIKVREDERDDEEEVSSQPVPVPLTFQQAAEQLQALRDFGLFTNQPQFTASIY